MLGSNQRPLPCEGGEIGCWRFLERAKLLQITGLPRYDFSQPFRRFTRVAARLLHSASPPMTEGMTKPSQRHPIVGRCQPQGDRSLTEPLLVIPPTSPFLPNTSPRSVSVDTRAIIGPKEQGF